MFFFEGCDVLHGVVYTGRLLGPTQCLSETSLSCFIVALVRASEHSHRQQSPSCFLSLRTQFLVFGDVSLFEILYLVANIAYSRTNIVFTLRRYLIRILACFDWFAFPRRSSHTMGRMIDVHTCTISAPNSALRVCSTVARLAPYPTKGKRPSAPS